MRDRIRRLDEVDEDHEEEDEDEDQEEEEEDEEEDEDEDEEEDEGGWEVGLLFPDCYPKSFLSGG